ncbi:MAG TPA: hypothetical protein PK006_10090 [Saprospiraceae bacterium]|nr:hypothetical protein [Saprospiraceae bacterium]
MNKIIDRTKHGVLVYGTCNGYMEFAFENLESPSYSHDLMDISETFFLRDIGKTPENTLFSITNKIDATIYTIYQGILDGSNRDGFYAISLYYHGLRLDANEVFDILLSFQKHFNFHIVEDNKIQRTKIGMIKGLFSLIPRIDGKHFLMPPIAEVSWLELENLGNRINGEVSYYINQVFKGHTLFIGKKGLKKTDTINFNRINLNISTILEAEAIKKVDQEKNTIKINFIASTLNGRNVPGSLFVKIDGETREYRSNDFPISLEIYSQDENSMIRFDFVPHDTKIYKEENKTVSFLELKSRSFKEYSMTMKENSSWKIKINQWAQISGLKITYNGVNINHQNGEIVIYEKQGAGKLIISSLSHKEKELGLDKTNIDRIESVILEPLVTNRKSNSNKSSNHEIKSGEGNYRISKTLRLVIIISIILLPVLVALLYNSNTEPKITCETLVIGQSGFDEFCRDNINCYKCKNEIPGEPVEEKKRKDSIRQKQIEDSIAALLGKDTNTVPLVGNKSATTSNSTTLENVKDKKITKPRRISCDNLNDYSKTDKENFCKKDGNYSCEKCEVTCNNFDYRRPEEKEKYCQYIIDNNKKKCDKCPSKQGDSPNNQPKADKSNKNCDGLNGSNTETLKKACKEANFERCEKCKDFINKK